MRPLDLLDLALLTTIALNLALSVGHQLVGLSAYALGRDFFFRRAATPWRPRTWEERVLRAGYFGLGVVWMQSALLLAGCVLYGPPDQAWPGVVSLGSVAGQAVIYAKDDRVALVGFVPHAIALVAWTAARWAA